MWRAPILLTVGVSIVGCPGEGGGATGLLPTSAVPSGGRDGSATESRPDSGTPDADAVPDAVGLADMVEPPDARSDGAPADVPGPLEVWAPGDVADADDLSTMDDAPDPSDTGASEDASTPDSTYPARYPPDRIHSPLTQSVVQRLSALHAMDPALAEDVFMKVGASTTSSPSYLGCFAGSGVALGEGAALQPTLDYFLAGDAAGDDPFSRVTLAAKVGVSAGWALAGDPSPLEQEYLALAPSFAFVHYGTNDLQMGTTHESALWGFGENLWTLTDELIGWGVIPILVTIAQRLDDDGANAWVDTYNTVIAAVAQGRQVPLLDANLAYEPLPNVGVGSDGIHSSVYPGGACQLTDEGLEYGMNMRNWQSLVALDRMRRAVVLGDVLDEPGAPLIGAGTIADPLLIPSLPFTDLRASSDGAADFDAYPGCNATQDESGPEVVYRLDLADQTQLRATVHDLDAVDVDLHIIDDSGTPDGCLARAHRIIDILLPPGVYYVVLDTFVSGGTPLSGEFIMTLEAMP